MNTWKLSIKPDSKEGFNAFDFCKKNSYLGVGWSWAYEEENAKNTNDAKRLVTKKFNNWPYQLRDLLESVKEGDHLWIHQQGDYYLCIAEKEIIFGRDISDDFRSYDLGHVRKAKWIKVPDIFVSGSIQRGTIAQRMIQRIHITQKEQEYSCLLADRLSEDENWRPSIDNILLQEHILKLNKFDLFSLMSPDDMEDIVSAYLQDQGWFLVKSTCFRSKPVFEFSMHNKDHKICNVQVKSGKYPDPLNPLVYKNFANDNNLVYLFSTNRDAYQGEQVPYVIPIKHEDIINWLTNNLWSLTLPLKTRLWLFLTSC